MHDLNSFLSFMVAIAAALFAGYQRGKTVGYREGSDFVLNKLEESADRKAKIQDQSEA